MNADDLPTAEDLWWSWAVLAATDRSIGGDTWSLDVDDHTLRLDRPGGWLRMQRLEGGRAVLWGYDDYSADDARAHGLDVLDGAPGWARSDVLTRSVRTEGAGFLAWQAHGEWDTSTPDLDDGADLLLDPLRNADSVGHTAVALSSSIVPAHLHQLLSGARTGHLDEADWAAYLGNAGDPQPGLELLRNADDEAQLTAQGSARTRLRQTVHAQMREATERERVVVERPAVLVQWSRITDLPVAFEHAVMVDQDRLLPATTNTGPPEQFALTLTNVLRQLHHDEASDESGAWLFARVVYDGRAVSLDRAFDHWPAWFTDDHGPSLEGLAWEMDQRHPDWRPGWASMLPRTQ